MPSDLIAAAWTEYGNALRLTGRYEESEKALNRAAAEPISDIPTRAHLLEVRGSLYRNTSQFEVAVGLLLEAVELQRSIGDSAAEARHHNHLGIIHLDSGNPERALSSFKTALDLFGPGAPRDVLASTGHNMVEAMIAAGRLSAAATALALLEPYHRNLTSTRLAAKAEWLRARLCIEMGQLHAAQLAFERAHALLITQPRSPELPALIQEMADLEAAIGRLAQNRGTNQSPGGAK